MNHPLWFKIEQRFVGFFIETPKYFKQENEKSLQMRGYMVQTCFRQGK